MAVAESFPTNNDPKSGGSLVSFPVVAMIVVGVIVAGVFFAIMASSLSAIETTKSTVTPVERLIARAEKDVRDKLKDPSSAQFKDDGGSVAGKCVYGEVLAKNSFGAFDGYDGFYWKNGYVHFESEMGLLDYTDAKTRCIEASLKSEDAGLGRPDHK